MRILFNQTALYDTRDGIVYILRNNQLVPQAIQFSDTESDMLTKMFPTNVKPAYVEILRQQTIRVLNSFFGLGRYILDLTIVPNDPAFGFFKFTFKSEGNPSVEFSVATLAHRFNQDPVNYSELRRYVIDEMNKFGYGVN